MNAIVAQTRAEIPTATPIPAFAPVLKPEDEEAAETRVDCAVVGAATDAEFWVPMTGEDKDEVNESVVDLGTELLCVACTSTNSVVEAGIVYPACA